MCEKEKANFGFKFLMKYEASVTLRVHVYSAKYCQQRQKRIRSYSACAYKENIQNFISRHGC